MSHIRGAAPLIKCTEGTSEQKLNNNRVQRKLCLKLLSGCHKGRLLAAGSGALPPPADPTYEWERKLAAYWISVNVLN